MVAGIVGVHKIHTHNGLLAPKGHYETLVFPGLFVLCQPVIRRICVKFSPTIVIVVSKDVACQKEFAKFAFAVFRSPRAMIAVAADYLHRVARFSCGLGEIERHL